ncbi:MAG: hypothetical protein J6C56_04605 [Alistipes sp.]|nr:hypothetical protein [Alistipes sp.]
MEIIEEGNVSRLQFTCSVCATKFIANRNDIRHGLIAIREVHLMNNGIDFGPSKVYSYRNYVNCPLCFKEIPLCEAEKI